MSPLRPTRPLRLNPGNFVKALLDLNYFTLSILPSGHTNLHNCGQPHHHGEKSANQEALSLLKKCGWGLERWSPDLVGHPETQVYTMFITIATMKANMAPFLFVIVWGVCWVCFSWSLQLNTCKLYNQLQHTKDSDIIVDWENLNRTHSRSGIFFLSFKKKKINFKLVRGKRWQNIRILKSRTSDPGDMDIPRHSHFLLRCWWVWCSYLLNWLLTNFLLLVFSVAFTFYGGNLIF